MIVRRALAEFPLKLALSLVLTLFFCVPYFVLQATPLFPVRRWSLTWIAWWVPQQAKPT